MRFRREVALIIFMGTAILMSSCIFLYHPAARSQATLEVDINYTDDFYRETFNYSREAENIQHYVLIVPEGEETRATASQIFHELSIQPDPGAPPIENPDFQWVLDYLHEAPGAYFKDEFEPGTYYVAVVFVAGPIPPEAVGAEEGDLYPGITGGGASTDFMVVELEAGETTELNITMTDDDGWACPWLYVYNGFDFERRIEVLRNVRGKSNEQTEVTHLGDLTPIDGAIILKLSEEKDETSYIDAFYLMVDGIAVHAEAAPAEMIQADQQYLTLSKGESVEFNFKLPESLANREQVSVSVVVSGYYLSH